MKRFILLLGVLLFQSAAFAQQTAQPIQRDPQAAAVLSQMAAATRWSSLAIPADAVATGTLTPYRGETQETASVVIKAKGSRQYRTEVLDATGYRTTILNGDTAAVLASDGTRFIPRHSAISMLPAAFPFLYVSIAVADGSASLRYLGTESLGSELTHRIEVVRESTPQQRAIRLVVWVSSATLLPVQIETTRVAVENPTVTRATARVLSDYRVVNGLAVPFRQEEYANGQRLYTLQLTSVRFNVGLSDIEFALPVAQGQE